jgi:hypothetical protein
MDVHVRDAALRATLVDPDLIAKIGALFQEKVATYPEWGRLLAAIPDTHL